MSGLTWMDSCEKEEQGDSKLEIKQKGYSVDSIGVVGKWVLYPCSCSTIELSAGFLHQCHFF